VIRHSLKSIAVLVEVAVFRHNQGVQPLPFGQRFVLAFAWFFRVLSDGAFAQSLKASIEQPDPPAKALPVRAPSVPPKRERLDSDPAPKRAPSALQLLALFQREGRLVDFLEQDITGFSDADVGAAARVVHSGCQKAFRRHATVRAIRDESEDARVEIESDYNAHEISLTGKVSGNGPFRGTLRHRGWRVTRFELASTLEGHNDHVLAPAEVEIA
jgi:Domain of unknown function (DUF2760)